MYYNKKIHSLTHLAKTVIGKLAYFSGAYTFENEELIVVNYHGTPRKYLSEFQQQIDFFLTHFNIISPAEIDNYYKSPAYSQNKPSLLITFDDGIKNNLYAAELLDTYNLKAIFFIIPDFIDTDIKEQAHFFKTNIRQEINKHLFTLDEDKTAMDWEEIKKLLKTGHFIGSHTSSHTLKSSEKKPSKSLYEIKTSKEKILQKTGYTVDSFCSPNDTLLSIGEEEIKLVKNNYSYLFSTYPGPNHLDKNPFFIKRCNIEAFWLKGAVIQATGKWDRKRWEKKIELFKKIVMVNSE